MKLNRAYTHRFSKLSTEFGYPFKLNEKSKETPYLLTQMLDPETLKPATTVRVVFDGDTVFSIETAAAMHREVWRGICAIVDDDETRAKATAIARAHDIAIAELRAGTLPGVTP